MPQPITNDFGRVGATREPRQLMFEEGFEGVSEPARFCLARGATCIGAGATNVLLDSVNLRDARNRFRSNRRIAPARRL